MRDGEPPPDVDAELYLIRDRMKRYALSLGVVATVIVVNPSTKKRGWWHVEGELGSPILSAEGSFATRVHCDVRLEPEFKKRDIAVFTALKPSTDHKFFWADGVRRFDAAEAEQRQRLELAVEELGRLENLQAKLKDDLQKAAADRAQAEKDANEKSQLLDSAKAERERLDTDKGKLEDDEKALQPYREYIDRIRTARRPPNVTTPSAIQPLKGRGPSLLDALSPLCPSRDFAAAYLLSLLTALANRRFLLLAGHVGVGKSHLVGESGPLLGGGTDLVPVRPGWLDPSDLFGYFDPLAGRFRDSRFTEAVARVPSGEDRPRLVLLDEMNVARIENYAADLLATLGSKEERIVLHARGSDGLGEVARAMLAEFPGHEKTRALRRLLKASRERALDIPNAVVFCGTLNVDGTTEELSPKTLDRAFLLRFPRPRLEDFDAAAPQTDPIPVSVKEARAVVRGADRDDGWHGLYREVEGFGECLIPLSRRVRDDHAAFVALGREMGIGDGEIRRAFAFARLLPRVAYDPGVVESGPKERLKAWLEGIEAAHPDGADAEAARRLLKAGEARVGHVLYPHVCG